MRGGGSCDIHQKCSFWVKTALVLDWWQCHSLTRLDIKWSPWQSYPSHLTCLVTVTQRWILPRSRFNFTKGAAPVTAKAARWWWMGAIHFQTKCKQGGILQTQVWPEMTAGLNSCTSSLQYAALWLSFDLFLRTMLGELRWLLLVCTQNYETWLNRKALSAEEGSCLHFTFRHPHQAARVICTLAF